MAGTYDTPNIVTLGSLDYVIQGAIQRQPAEEFAVGLRSGPPSYDGREGAQFVNYHDFTGGMGVRVGDFRDYPDRFWASRDVRTWDSAGDLTLAPACLQATLGTITPAFSGFSSPGGAWCVAPLAAAQTITLFGAMGNKVFKTTGTTSAATFTDISPGSGPANAATAALVFHQNPTNVLDKSLYWATGATDEVWKYNLLNETWSQPLTGANGYADDLIEFDNKLLKVHRGQLSLSPDGGATWTGDISDLTGLGGGFIRVPSNNQFSPFFAGLGLDAYGQVVPYLVSAGELYAIDIWTYQAIKVDLGLPSSITAAICWQDGETVVTDGYYVKAYHPDRPVRNMGFDRDNGLQTQAFIRNFCVVAGKYLLAHVDVGSDLFNIYMWDGKGWHVVTGSDAIFGPFGLWAGLGKPSMVLYNGSSVFNPAQTLFAMAYATTPRIHVIQTDAFKNPQLNGSHKYAGSVAGYIITPWFDGGFAEMDGTAIEVEVHGIFNGSSKQLAVTYRLNNSTGSFTTLGTTSGTDTIQRFQFASGQGISFKNIQFEFDFSRDSTNTNSPVVRAIVFKYIKVPRLRSTYSFTVDVEHTARKRGVSEETVIDTLYALVDDTPLVPLAYVGESTTFVRFREMPRLDYLRQEGSAKTGTIRVVVEEPV